MNILAVDASNAACSVALHYHQKIYSEIRHEARQQTRLLLPLIDDVLKQANAGFSDLDAIAFCRGPGSFTGVRLTASVVQGLAFAANLGILPVSSMQALALQYYFQTSSNHVLVCLDARKQEVYYGFYIIENSIPVLLGEERVGSAEQIIFPDTSSAQQEWSLVGDGVIAYEKEILRRLPQSRIIQPVIPFTSAGYILQLALQLYTRDDVKPAEQAIPVYIRDNVTG